MKWFNIYLFSICWHFNNAFLIYPRQKGFLKFLCGFGVAVDDDSVPMTIVNGAVFRVDYPLPISSQNITNFGLLEMKSKTRANMESFTMETGGKYRWIFYKALKILFQKYGYDGKACLLRSICEIANTPFHHSYGLLAEIFYILLTPSTSIEKPNNRNDYDYINAEKIW